MKNYGGEKRQYSTEELEIIELFGRVLRKTRKLLHISQDTLALESQVSQNFVSKLEKGYGATRNFEHGVALIIEGLLSIWHWDCLKGIFRKPIWIKQVQKRGVFKCRWYFEKFLEDSEDDLEVNYE